MSWLQDTGTSRRRLPMRKAISRARTGALLVSRPATFAHAMNSTGPASNGQHRNPHGARRGFRDSVLDLGSRDQSDVPVAFRGTRVPNPAAMTDSSAWACANVTPRLQSAPRLTGCGTRASSSEPSVGNC